MEDKIETGEYVRTKSGEIYKLADKKNYDFIRDKFYFRIAKHSKQLIDLIDKDDYVNGHKVIKLKDGFADGTMEMVLSNNTIIYRHHSEDIKTILTKEQYMANCYKVGGEE